LRLSEILGVKRSDARLVIAAASRTCTWSLTKDEMFMSWRSCPRSNQTETQGASSENHLRLPDELTAAEGVRSG
jgi:hypothetical protein